MRLLVVTLLACCGQPWQSLSPPRSDSRPNKLAFVERVPSMLERDSTKFWTCVVTGPQRRDLHNATLQIVANNLLASNERIVRSIAYGLGDSKSDYTERPFKPLEYGEVQVTIDIRTKTGVVIVDRRGSTQQFCLTVEYVSDKPTRLIFDKYWWSSG